MDTKVVTPDKKGSYGESLGQVAAALRAGALVVFPTETVYGVGANALDPDAVARLRAAKGRADEQPFTVHLPGRSAAGRYVSSPSPLARRLARKAWPGPLTLICSVPDPQQEPIGREADADQLRSIYHDNKVGLRCPANAAACEVLRLAEVPVVASSANRAGQAPPSNIKAALRDLDGEVEYAIDSGPTQMTSASTIVEIDGDQWMMRRAGSIDERTISRLARTEIMVVCTGNTCRSPIAEYLFRQKLAERLDISLEALARQGYFVSSAGTAAFGGGPISDPSRAELKRRSIDASAHHAQPLTIEKVQSCERIFTMTQAHRDAVVQLVPAAADRVMQLDSAGNVPDPIGAGAAQYEACANQIEAAIDVRLEEFLNEDRDW